MCTELQFYKIKSVIQMNGGDGNTLQWGATTHLLDCKILKLTTTPSIDKDVKQLEFLHAAGMNVATQKIL